MNVLLEMEKTGIKVETDMLQGLAREFAAKLADLEKECYALAGESFNIESPKQLGFILFEKLEIDKKAGVRAKKTMSGATSTDTEVLEKLAEHHALPAKILEYRSFQKLKGTYIDALPQLVNKK